MSRRNGPGRLPRLASRRRGYPQLRAKSHGKEMISQVAARVIPHCRATGVPFILNDHPDLAAALDADGVHIGQDDGTLAAARISVGPGKMIGRSTHSPAQALAALDEGFDYIGFGPLFPTPTKAGRRASGCKTFVIWNVLSVLAFPRFASAGSIRSRLVPCWPPGRGAWLWFPRCLQQRMSKPPPGP